MSVASPGPNVEEQVILETKQTNDYIEHEELDFEEEYDSQEMSKVKIKPENGDNEEEGELSPVEDEMKDSDIVENDVDETKIPDKEEIDLEEGEILSDDEPETTGKGVPKLQFMKGDEPNLNMNNRHYNSKYIFFSNLLFLTDFYQ